LAELPEDASIPDMTAATRRKLTRQARLQQAKRDTGRDHYELLPQEAGQGRGLARLPQPDPADLFFDMEGDRSSRKDWNTYSESGISRTGRHSSKPSGPQPGGGAPGL